MPRVFTGSTKERGVVDREERLVRVPGGDYPFVWREAEGLWIGPSQICIEMLDNRFMEKSGTTGIDWSYLTSTGLWSLQALPDAKDLWAFGCRLQDRASARMLSGTSTYQIAPWFYQYDDNDFVEFANDVAEVPWPPGSGQTIFSPPGGTTRQTDGSTTGTFGQPYSANYGRGVILGVSSTVAKMRGTPWTDVSITQPTVDGTLSSTPADIVKDLLYPTVYAKEFPAGQTGQAATYKYEMRWIMRMPM